MDLRTSERTSAGLAAVAAAAALWAVAAVVASNLFEAGVEPIHLAAARSFVTLAGLACLPGAWRRPSRVEQVYTWAPLTTRDAPLRQIVPLGLAIAGVNIVYYLAIDRLPVALALVLQYTAPAIVVAWVALIDRRRPSATILLALAGALAGVTLASELLSNEVAQVDMIGIGLGLASAVLFALYTLLSEKVVAIHGPQGGMLRAFAVSAGVWAAYFAITESPGTILDVDRLPAILFVGLAGTLAPFLLYVWGVQRVRAERGAIAATLEPVVAAVLAWVWLGQSLSTLQIAGGLIVIVSVAMLSLKKERKPVTP